MLGSSGREQGRKRASELGVFRASKVPKCGRIHRRIKTENFFDAAVTVGGDHQVLPRKARLGVGDTDHHVVVKLSLLVVGKQVVRSQVLSY